MSSRQHNVTKLESSYMKQYDAYLERQKRKKQRLIRRLVLFAIITLIISSCMIGYHLKQRAVYAEKLEEYEQLDEKLQSLLEEEKAIKEEIELLKKEDYVLDIARTNYFFLKKGN